MEAIEQRLTADILAESIKYVEQYTALFLMPKLCRYGGLVLTHNEVAVDNGDGKILPTWTAVDSNNVKTPRELFETMRKSGWSVEVVHTTHFVTYILTPTSTTGKSPQRTIELARTECCPAYPSHLIDP